MPWAAWLSSDASLIGYSEVGQDVRSGTFNAALFPSAPQGAMTLQVFAAKPDLPADGTYYWDQPAQCFLPQSRRSPRPPSVADDFLRDALRRAAAGERLPDWMQEAIAGMIGPTP